MLKSINRFKSLKTNDLFAISNDVSPAKPGTQHSCKILRTIFRKATSFPCVCVLHIKTESHTPSSSPGNHTFTSADASACTTTLLTASSSKTRPVSSMAPGNEPSDAA